MNDCNKCRYLAQGTIYCGLGLNPKDYYQELCPKLVSGPTAKPVETSNHSRTNYRGRSYTHLEPSYDHNSIGVQALDILWPPLPNRITIPRVHRRDIEYVGNYEEI